MIGLGNSAFIQPILPADFENLDRKFLYICFASSTKSPEVWVYGHVQQTDYRAKLSFSFEVEHAELKPVLTLLHDLGI